MEDLVSPRQQEGDGLVCVEEGRRVGRRGAKEGVGDTRVRSMLVMFEQWTVMGMEWMEAAQEKGHGFPRKEHEPARQSRSTKEPACVSSFPSLEDLLC